MRISSISPTMLTWGGFSNNRVRIKNDRISQLLLPLLHGQMPWNEIVEEVSRSGKATRPYVARRLTRLLQIGLLEEGEQTHSSSLSDKELERYSRQFVFFSMFQDFLPVQEKLKGSTVLLLGLGGIGSHLLYTLAGSGIGKIRCLDGDRIELSNLNRQILYQESDIGKLKADAAQKRIRGFNSSIAYEFIPEMIKSKGQLRGIIKDCDIVILSADSPFGIDAWVNEACIDEGIPYSMAGYRDYFGSVGPIVIPGKTSCLECDRLARYDAMKGYEQILKVAHKSFRPPSIGPVNGILANIQAMEVIKFLTGFIKPTTLDRQLLIDFRNFKMEWLSYRRNPRCRACGSKSGIGARKKSKNT